MNLADAVSIVFMVLFILGLMVIMFSISIFSTSSSKSKLEAIELEKDADELAVFDELIDWAEENEYKWIDAYWGRFPGSPSPMIVAWRHESGTFLASYKFGGAIATDFFTMFDENRWISLTTSKTQSGEPHPKMTGSFGQFHKKIDIQALEEKHLSGIEFLTIKFGLEIQDTDKPFEEYFLGWVRAGSRYVKSQPFWMVRGLAWYAKRNRYRDIHVSERYAHMTLADLPTNNDIFDGAKS